MGVSSMSMAYVDGVANEEGGRREQYAREVGVGEGNSIHWRAFEEVRVLLDVYDWDEVDPVAAAGHHTAEDCSAMAQRMEWSRIKN